MTKIDSEMKFGFGTYLELGTKNVKIYGRELFLYNMCKHCKAYEKHAKQLPVLPFAKNILYCVPRELRRRERQLFFFIILAVLFLLIVFFVKSSSYKSTSKIVSNHCLMLISCQTDISISADEFIGQ